MQKINMALFIVAILFITSMSTTATAKTEIQEYETLFRDGNFEIRYYPSAVMASVEMEGSYDKMKNKGFRTLAGYIFGNNQQNMKISMTSPVRFSENRDEVRMSFVMPSEMDLENLPEPGDERIHLHRTDPVYVASLKFGGYSSDAKIEARKKELMLILQHKGIKYSNDFEYLGYNPPYKIFNRRNEVIVFLPGFEPGMIKTAVR